jgi:hypothetical protein
MRLPKWYALLPLALLTPYGLVAQTVHGEVMEEEARIPVEGALVLLVDAAGRERTGAFSNRNGRFVLEAPEPGRYTVRAERIGFRLGSSGAFDLHPGQRLEQRVLLPVEAVELRGVTVEATRRCQIRPGEGDLTAYVWDRARTALNATRWTQGRSLYQYQVREYHRDLDVNTLRVQRERTSERTRLSDRPFVSRSPEALGAEGYRRLEGTDHVFYAPDAGVLLSDEFLDSHCFRAQRPGRGQEGLVGLGFEPVSRRSDFVDIRGVLWLDEASTELRYVEFFYTGLPSEMGSNRIGGRVDFERLPSGHWIVRRYYIRMPRGEAVMTMDSRGRRDHFNLTGIQEFGAEVVELVSPTTSRRAPDRGALLGTVTERRVQRPLVGATVFLDGTSFSTTTDAAGRFRFDDIPAGSYQVRFYHPLMERLTALPAPRGVVVDSGATAEVELSMP